MLAEKIIASVQWVVVVVVQVTARGRRGPEGAHHRRLLTPDSTDPLHTRQQPGKPTPRLLHGIKSWVMDINKIFPRPYLYPSVGSELSRSCYVKIWRSRMQPGPPTSGSFRVPPQ